MLLLKGVVRERLWTVTWKKGGGSFAAGTKGAWELGVGRGGVNCDGDDRPMMAVAQPGKEPMKVNDERTR